MALMDAGVQIPEHIAGIAMGLIAKDGKAAILSDILGDEDALGDMDFKVTGTAKGIVGCQMDIKIDGMPYELLEKALEQARQGRLHILGKLNDSIKTARPELKPHVPRVDVVTIEKSFIGAVIGPGGKIIQEIQESTGTTISIDEVDGRGVVHIYGKDAEAVKKARARVDTITHVPEVGNVYEGRVASLMPYGVFVDFMGRSGLLHIFITLAAAAAQRRLHGKFGRRATNGALQLASPQTIPETAVHHSHLQQTERTAVAVRQNRLGPIFSNDGSPALANFT
jgi:polyribonucleotide nucleotidyltransferase